MAATFVAVVERVLRPAVPRESAVGRVDEILARFRGSDDAPILDAKRGFFFLHAPGGIIAAQRRCTHLGCTTIEFEARTDQLDCLCHSAYFDKRTAVVTAGPAPEPLSLFHVRAESGLLYVSVDPRDVIRRRSNRWEATHLEVFD